MSAVYRRTELREFCDFRTVSDEAAGAIVGMIPINTLVDEMIRLFNGSVPHLNST